jgi:hypothetical protein
VCATAMPTPTLFHRARAAALAELAALEAAEQAGGAVVVSPGVTPAETETDEVSKGVQRCNVQRAPYGARTTYNRATRRLARRPMR